MGVKLGFIAGLCAGLAGVGVVGTTGANGPLETAEAKGGSTVSPKLMQRLEGTDKRAIAAIRRANQNRLAISSILGRPNVDVNVTSPAGPQGPSGAAGPEGPRGETGAAGANSPIEGILTAGPGVGGVLEVPKVGVFTLMNCTAGSATLRFRPDNDLESYSVFFIERGAPRVMPVQRLETIDLALNPVGSTYVVLQGQGSTGDVATATVTGTTVACQVRAQVVR